MILLLLKIVDLSRFDTDKVSKVYKNDQFCSNEKRHQIEFFRAAIGSFATDMFEVSRCNGNFPDGSPVTVELCVAGSSVESDLPKTPRHLKDSKLKLKHIISIERKYFQS